MSERDEKILALYRSGAKIKEIAAAVGMAPNSMVGILRRLGIERPSKPQKRWHGESDPTADIERLWKEGLCASQIKERLSISRSVVDAALVRLSVRDQEHPRHRYDGAATGGSGRSGFAGNMARRT